MRRKTVIRFLLAVLAGAILWRTGSANADIHSNHAELRSSVGNYLSADVADAAWAKTAEDTVIAVYHTETGFGTAILKYSPSAGFSVLEKNDRMIPWLGGSASVRLDDHTPEYSIEIGWDHHSENDYLTLQADDQGTWRVQGLEYVRKEEGLEDISVFCHLSSDGKTAVISPLVDPRIEWTVDQEFTVKHFNLADARKLCENALAILRDPERTEDAGPGYRIVHVALDQYEPVIPNRFDSRMDEENHLLYLSRKESDELFQTEWIFHWEDQKEAWVLVQIRESLLNGPGLDGTLTVTESATEISAEAIRSTQLLKNRETQENLYVFRDVTFPNVLDPESLFLKKINFDSPPVNARGYNWSRDYGAYADPALMKKLFEVFFPDDTFVDGYLQEDKTLMFIARKADGTLVLLCGADEGETGWDWVESAPLPEGTRIGDENITDAVNLNAWNGGAAVGVRKTGKGRWGVYYVNSYDFFAGPDWIGTPGSETGSQFFGTHAWGDIAAIDWSSLPPEEYTGSETKEEKEARISALVDRTDWATTAQNEPEGTTELLEQAGNSSRLLGRLYNGTPLYVLERGTEWTKVRIGHGEGSGTITGWMRTKDLAFGDDTLRISRETIRLRSEQVLIHPVESFVGSRAGKITSEQFSSCLVIGEAEAGQSYAVIYYLWDGDVGLVPTAGLGNGNG